MAILRYIFSLCTVAALCFAGAVFYFSVEFRTSTGDNGEHAWHGINSFPVFLITLALFLTASITSFHKHFSRWLLQNSDSGDCPLPEWIAGFRWLHYGLLIALLFLNAKYAVILWIALFVLSVIPVLDTAGNILLAPLRRGSEAR